MLEKIGIIAVSVILSLFLCFVFVCPEAAHAANGDEKPLYIGGYHSASWEETNEPVTSTLSALGDGTSIRDNDAVQGGGGVLGVTLTDWFSFEIQGEHAGRFVRRLHFEGEDGGPQLEADIWSFTANLRAHPQHLGPIPTTVFGIQPYALVGFGVMGWETDIDGLCLSPCGHGFGLDDTVSAAMRVGAGIERPIFGPVSIGTHISYMYPFQRAGGLARLDYYSVNTGFKIHFGSN